MENKLLGIILILFGAFWFLGNLNIIRGDFTLIIVGIGFIIAYYFTGNKGSKRNLGFIIPGCITLMVGSFALLESNRSLGSFSGSLFFLFIGTAFWMIYFIHTLHYCPKGSGSRNWPMYTGAALYAFSGFILMVELFRFRYFRFILINLWPIAFIIAGLIFIFKGLKK